MNTKHKNNTRQTLDIRSEYVKNNYKYLHSITNIVEKEIKYL